MIKYSISFSIIYFRVGHIFVEVPRMFFKLCLAILLPSTLAWTSKIPNFSANRVSFGLSHTAAKFSTSPHQIQFQYLNSVSTPFTTDEINSNDNENGKETVSKLGNILDNKYYHFGSSFMKFDHIEFLCSDATRFNLQTGSFFHKYY